jgi:hypothetical protein
MMLLDVFAAAYAACADTLAQELAALVQRTAPTTRESRCSGRKDGSTCRAVHQLERVLDLAGRGIDGLRRSWCRFDHD